MAKVNKKTSPAELMQKELEAQRKRAEALQYLKEQGCGPSEFEQRLTPEGYIGTADAIKAGTSRDNTIDQIRKRKTALVEQQSSLRDKIIEAHNARPLENALPPGWKQVSDPSSGRIYYYNDQTGQTQWLRPEGAAKMPLPAAAAGGTGAEAGAEAGGASGEGADCPPPPGWRKIQDPASGKTYFWHQASGKTQWSRPEGADAAEGRAGEDGASKEGCVGLAGSKETPAANDETLPPGWEKKFHPASKQYYYFHTATKERRWTKPETENDGSDIRAPDIEQSGGGGGQRSAQDRREERRRRKNKKGGGEDDEVDPMDPTGNKKGKWTDGMINMGERMADSTASGPLWQQRPYPAPGQVLRGLAKPKEPKNGPIFPAAPPKPR